MVRSRPRKRIRCRAAPDLVASLSVPPPTEVHLAIHARLSLCVPDDTRRPEDLLFVPAAAPVAVRLTRPFAAVCGSLTVAASVEVQPRPSELG